MSDIRTDAKRSPRRRTLVRQTDAAAIADEASTRDRSMGDRSMGDRSMSGIDAAHSDMQGQDSMPDHLSANASQGVSVVVRDLHKSYRKGKLEIPVLRGVDLQVAAGEFVALIGQSGSGKSTLLHLLGMLDAPDQGEILFGDKRVDSLSTRQRDRLRNREIGLIFQFYHLLPELSVLENVLMPRMIGTGIFAYPWKRREYKERATHLLELVGLGHRMTHKPRELSGGEMQRTAIARALMVSPRLLLADEPTGNLDSRNGSEILGILRELNQAEGVTILMVTHDNEIAKRADATIRLVEGRVQKNRNAA